MLDWAASQGLTDALSATALGACVTAAWRRGVRSPLERRLMFAFSGLALFYIFRSAANFFHRPAFELAAIILVSVLPVVGLLLAEGLVRRHAPGWLKVAITAGAVISLFSVISVVSVVIPNGGPPAATPELEAYVLLSLLALTVLLFMRDRASLSYQENAAIDGFLLAGAALLLLSVTDFLAASPLGMSGAGAAGLAFVARAKPTSSGAIRRSALDLLVVILAGLIFTAGLIDVLAIGLTVERIRLGVIVLVLLIAVTNILYAVKEQPIYDDAQRLRRALATADTTGLTEFLESLADQPLLKGLRIGEGDLLVDYDADTLLETLRARPVWSRHALRRVGSSPLHRGEEELADLMARTDSSHVALISQNPVRVALLTLPELGAIEDVETDFALFRKLAALAAAAAA